MLLFEYAVWVPGALCCYHMFSFCFFWIKKEIRTRKSEHVKCSTKNNTSEAQLDRGTNLQSEKKTKFFSPRFTKKHINWFLVFVHFHSDHVRLPEWILNTINTWKVNVLIYWLYYCCCVFLMVFWWMAPLWKPKDIIHK